MQGEASLMGLASFLSQNGFNVDNTPYPFYRDLRFVEERLARRIKRAREITGRKVDIVGHSTGAVMSLALARRIPEEIDRVIALGLPEKGSEFALVISFLPSGRQLFPWHRYMKKMIGDSFPPGVSLYLIQGEGDILVPRKFFIFPEGGSNITKVLIKDTGHLGLIEQGVFPLIYQILNGSFPGGEGVIEFSPYPEKQSEVSSESQDGLWNRFPFPLSSFLPRRKTRSV
jgi:pimeloyl-ACP methyl ester carboxylesterase